jgi:hypothetical protein
MCRFVAILLSVAFGGLSAWANDNPFGYSNDTGITRKGEHELQQSITIRSGLDQGSGFDGGYRGYDLSTQFEFGLSDVEHLDIQASESILHATGLRFDGLNVEYKHLLGNDENNRWGAAWVAAIGYSQMDTSNGSLRKETSCAFRLLLQKSFGSQRQWCYVTNLSAELAQTDGTTGELEWSQGIACRADDHWTCGLESVVTGAWTRFHRFDNSALRVGPCLAYKTGEFSVSLTALWQVSGAPATDGGRNLRDTCRSETRMLVSFGF